MAEFDVPDDMRDETRAAWQRYLDLLNPFRPDLHRYCRRLAGDLWDAEDLVQDTLLRAFATLGFVHRHIENPRAYLLRIATNLWIDARRRRALEAALVAEAAHESAAAVPPTQAAEARDAGAVLLQRLAPQERAALVMQEVFDMSLEEMASVLGTTMGAIKAALHRGRTRLREPADAPSRRERPSAALVDRFVERLNALDLPGLLALMLDTASVEEIGNVFEIGRSQFDRPGSWLHQAVHVHPELPAEMRPPRYRNERGTFAGEPVMLSFVEFAGSRLLMSVTRLVEEDGRIARIRAYNFSPEVIGEVGTALGLAVGHVPYRFPTPAPGQYW
jgi:RNA polymerase sigma-70 factor (ECF subfamily)